MKEPRVKSSPARKAPGVLEKATAAAGLSEAEQESVWRWLEEQFLADQHAKLGQAGYTDSRIPLRQVFVDLPVGQRASGYMPGVERVTFLKQLGATKARVLCPDEESTLDGRARPGAYLLVGGPGQGKSTLSQYAVQIHRAALLGSGLDQLTPSTQSLVRDIAVEQQPKRPLLPLFVPLPELAGWEDPATPLEASDAPDEQPPFLLRFIAERPSGRKAGLKAHTLWRLSQQLGVFLVLDGFDEVGDPGVRARLVEVARSLLAALAESKMVSILLATTRPQGYTNEFARLGLRLEERHLLPLTVDEALRYGERLTRTKIQGADHQQKMLERMQQAAQDEVAARLLSTPLQVTILAALLEQHGRVPRERWRLFQGYFEYTYNREVERGSWASPLLGDQRTRIERLHERVALLLQVQAELQTASAAHLGRGQLEAVTRELMAEDDIPPTEAQELVAQVLLAAENRLVFLVEPIPGQVGFEIRSLQEFLAARLLIKGPDREVELRLTQVAKASMFRNTLLFAVSEAFGGQGHRRDFLSALCQQVDEDPTDPGMAETRAGALLALGILEEGTVLNQPKWTQIMLERACGVLALPPGQDQVRLAQLSAYDKNGAIERAVERGLQMASQRSGAWVCLAEATNLGRPWALRVAEEAWTSVIEPQEVVQWLRGAGIRWGSWLGARLDERAADIPASFLVGFRVEDGERANASSWSAWLGGMSFNGPPAGEPPGPPPDAWLPWIAALRFLKEQSAHHLADVLEAVARSIAPDQWEQFALFLPIGLPGQTIWPLIACLKSAEQPEELLEYAQRARSGALGDHTQWSSVEPFMYRGKTKDPREVTLDRPWSTSEPSQHPVSVVAFVARFEGSLSPKLDWADRHFDQVSRPKLKRDLATLCLISAARSGKVPTGIPLARVRQWVAAVSGLDVPVPVLFDPEVSDLDPAGWRVLWRAVARSLQWGGSDLSRQTRRFLMEAENPLLWQLAEDDSHILRRRFGQEVLLEAQRLLAEPAPSELEQVERTLLRLPLAPIPPHEDRDLVERVIQLSEAHPSLPQLLIRALREGPTPRPRAEAMLLQLLSHLPAGPLRSDVITALREVLQARRSGLDDPPTWDRLGLRKPYPLRHKSGRPDQAWPQVPIRLQRIELQHVRGLDHLKIEPVAGAADAGQWLVVLGRNGTGKTTLLRSLALALRNLKDPAIWPKGCFSNRWPALGAGEAVVSVTWADQQYATSIRENGSRIIVQNPEQRLPRLLPLFAYGCRRGSALGAQAGTASSMMMAARRSLPSSMKAPTSCLLGHG
jgi:hypothetical protein